MNVVITGAGKGIGFASARRLAEEGHTVFGLSRNVVALRKLNHTNIVSLQCDLCDQESVRLVSEEIVKSGPVEVLINNAGVLVNKPFEALTDEDWLLVYRTNVLGMSAMMRMLLPGMKKGKLSDDVKAHVVNISSMGGVQGSSKFPGLSAYSSSKGAVITLTECLAEEFRDIRIAVNCLALGSVSTEMFRAAFPGVRAAVEATVMAEYVCDFALNGWRFFNGKTLPVSSSTP